MIFLLAAFATICVLLLLLTNPYAAVPILVAVKPLIDATWESSLLGLSLLDIIGVMVPVLMLTHIMRSRRFRMASIPLAGVGLVFLFWNLIVAVGMAMVYGDALNAADYAFRALNFYLGLFLIPFFVRDAVSFRRLLVFMLIAGLFPILMGIYQTVTGTIWELRTGSYGLLQRNVGLYHDAFSFRAYGFQTLTAIILTLSYFMPRQTLWKFVLIGYAILCAIVLFKVYSKAAVVVGLSWLIIWSMFHRNKSGAVLAVLIGSGFFLLGDSLVFKQLELVFTKEIAVYQGQLEDKFILAGRPTIWTRYWNEWLLFDPLTKLIGYWKHIPAHNDLLRVIYTAGVIGLLAYFLFLWTAGAQLFKRLLGQKTPLTIMGVMVFAMWIVDVTGLTPSIYPAYCWYVWGFVVLAIRGVPGLEVPKSRHGTTSPKFARDNELGRVNTVDA